CRYAGAISRMSATFQQGLQALQRKRTGGNQHVTVKHIHQQVNVTEGGQAVVAGDTVTRGQGERRRGMSEKGTMNPLKASQSTVCGLAWKRYSRQTPLRDVAPALNGRASLAGVRPCRTGAASFMVARARGRARRRA